MGTKPRFEYNIRCQWCEDPADDDDGIELTEQPCWWDDLPQTYTVKRRWSDIVKFHKLVKELSVDSSSGLLRVKAKLPKLPMEGDLDQFVMEMAAIGDVCVLREKGAMHTQTITGDSALARLADEHTILVDNHLTPYLVAVSKVLAELPVEELRESMAFRLFTTDGASCKPRPGPEDPLKALVGPSSMMLEPSDADRIARNARRRAQRGGEEEGGGKAADTSKPKPTTTGKAKAAQATAVVGGTHLAVPASRGSNRSTSPRSPISPLSPGLGNSLSAPQLTVCEWDSGERTPTPARGATAATTTTHYSYMASRMPGEAFDSTSTRDHWKRMVAKERRELGRRTMVRTRRSVPARPSMLRRPLRPETLQLHPIQVGLSPAEAVEVALAGKPRPDASMLSSIVDSQDFSFPLSPPTGLSFISRRRRDVERMPDLPPAGRSDPIREFSASVLADYEQSIPGPTSPVAVKELMKITTTPLRPPRVEAVERDICEGLRVIILGQQPAERLGGDKLHMVPPPKVYPRFTPREVLQVFGTYRKMVTFEEPSKSEELSTRPSTRPNTAASVGEGARLRPPHAVAPDELTPISWPAFFAWAEQALLDANDFRYKSVIGAFNRALAIWRTRFASPSRVFAGVSLVLMLQWTWPGRNARDVVEMLTWICSQEVNAMRVPTPRLLDKEETSLLESMFNSMDSKGRGVLSPEDIAGGKDSDDDALKSLKNVVDADTVKAVVGDRCIALQEFLELMCGDDRRACEASTEAAISDDRKVDRLKLEPTFARKVVLQKRSALSFEGWVIRDDYMSKEEAEQRRLVDALEAELLRWRSQAAELRATTPSVRAATPVSVFGATVSSGRSARSDSKLSTTFLA